MWTFGQPENGSKLSEPNPKLTSLSSKSQSQKSSLWATPFSPVHPLSLSLSLISFLRCTVFGSTFSKLVTQISPSHPPWT